MTTHHSPRSASSAEASAKADQHSVIARWRYLHPSRYAWYHRLYVPGAPTLFLPSGVDLDRAVHPSYPSHSVFQGEPHAR